MNVDVIVSLVLVLFFVLVGGVFAGTELALVSLRESQLDQMAKRGKRGAKVAEVARNPNRFLSAVQIGVTVAGFFSAAYGASALAPQVAPLLERLGLSADVSGGVATALLTLIIAFLSLVFGELVPKRIALQRAAGIAIVVTPPLDTFATLMRPVIWLLSVCTDAVVRLLGGDPNQRGETMSPEELRDLVAGHEGLRREERDIVSEVLDAGNRTMAEVMRPRGDVVFLPVALTAVEARERVAAEPYSRYPLIGEDVDDLAGFLHIRDLAAADDDVRLDALAREIALVPDTAHLLPTLSMMRRTRHQIAVVVDEFGGTDGIVTLEDLIEELVGDIHDEYDTPELAPVGDGADLDASLTIEEFAARTGYELPDGPFETVGGFVVARLGRLARIGDVVAVRAQEEAAGPPAVQIRVTEVERHRVRQVRVDHGSAPAAADAAEGTAGEAGTGGDAAR